MAGPIRVLFDFHSANYELWNFPETLYATFVERFPTVMFHNCTSSADFRTHLPAAKIIFGRWLRPEDLPLAAELEWFHTSAAGVERQLYPEWVARNIRLTTSAGARGPAMAEWVMGALIAVNRQFPRLWAAQQAREWIDTALWTDYQQIRTLEGQRMVIAGLGGIGQEVARLAKAFGMEVGGTKRDTTTDIPWVDRIASPEELLDLLPGALAVVDCLPSTPATQQLFDAAHFAAMGPEAVFINVGRGATVDQAALVEALQTQAIRGAILDVVASEPLPADSPLWHLPNVMVAPHVSNIVDRFWEPTAELFFENLRRYLLQMPLLNEVDQASGGY